MANEVPSQQEIYDLVKNEIQSRDPNLTDFEEGSILDSLAGGYSVGAQEIIRLILNRFSKTFFNTANGPEVTGGPDDLQTLAVDHFGDSFSRPEAAKAVGTVTFSRPTTGAGAVSILAGTIVKTDKDANGEEQRFQTLSDVTLTGLTIDASVEAIEAGTAGNVGAGTVINLETSLTDDTVTVSNASAFAGGSETSTDAEYREFIRNQVEVIRGATKASIEAAALNVAGIETATAIETLQAVIEWDVGGSMTIGEFFRIPRVKLYVADVNGTASSALIDNVETAVALVRACGVFVEVLAATPLSLDWDATITLDPGGPNFAELSSDTSKIVTSMEEYVKALPIGTGFDRGLAKLAILDIWGSGGTGDLTDFVTNTPSGGVTAAATEKLIPGTVTIS